MHPALLPKSTSKVVRPFDAYVLSFLGLLEVMGAFVGPSSLVPHELRHGLLLLLAALLAFARAYTDRYRYEDIDRDGKGERDGETQGAHT